MATSTHVQADRMRLLALRVRAVGAIRWRSEAADLYRAQVEARARRLELEAEATHELARTFDDLATMVERRGTG
ncbi:hypothetical protein P0Y31_12500 [Knoellia sp. 3-2P3]|uniref:hypothetical protein n=1 Tax=unclassified Knoellia TaxID=2618719 RepID=UPI0023DAEB52|nr:hypothetical protein [Knoellia sp. 3-2P3]MDF2093166.1 hypothetical protein [Knoellia sp. 3-2P3]